MAETVRNVLKRQRPILEVDPPFHVGIRQRPVRFHLKRCRSARGEVRINGFRQLQIDGPARRKVKLLRAIYPHINIQVFYQKDFQDLVFKYGLKLVHS